MMIVMTKDKWLQQSVLHKGENEYHIIITDRCKPDENDVKDYSKSSLDKCLCVQDGWDR